MCLLFFFRKNQKRLLGKEEKIALKERHWKMKELSEMADRDWRIFKEDYNISAKGILLTRTVSKLLFTEKRNESTTLQMISFFVSKEPINCKSVALTHFSQICLMLPIKLKIVFENILEMVPN